MSTMLMQTMTNPTLCLWFEWVISGTHIWCPALNEGSYWILYRNLNLYHEYFFIKQDNPPSLHCIALNICLLQYQN